MYDMYFMMCTLQQRNQISFGFVTKENVRYVLNKSITSRTSQLNVIHAKLSLEICCVCDSYVRNENLNPVQQFFHFYRVNQHPEWTQTTKELMRPISKDMHQNVVYYYINLESSRKQKQSEHSKNTYDSSVFDVCPQKVGGTTFSLDFDYRVFQ